MGDLDTPDLVIISDIRRRLKSGEIRTELKNANIRHAEVARVLKLDHASVSRWLSGDASPDPDNALRLAELLNALSGKHLVLQGG